MSPPFPLNHAMRSPSRCGFTLVEIMIVVVIVGLLAALAIPALNRVRQRAVCSSYLNDVRQIRDGAERYAMENGGFPPNGVAGLHASLQGYVPAKLFGATTPLGGVWDWDYQQSGITAAVSVYRYTASDAMLLDIDRTIDDGVLGTGLFQRRDSKVIYVMQP